MRKRCFVISFFLPISCLAEENSANIVDQVKTRIRTYESYYEPSEKADFLASALEELVGRFQKGDARALSSLQHNFDAFNNELKGLSLDTSSSRIS